MAETPELLARVADLPPLSGEPEVELDSLTRPQTGFSVGQFLSTFRLSLLLEVGLDGAPSRLEVVTAAGLLLDDLEAAGEQVIARPPQKNRQPASTLTDALSPCGFPTRPLKEASR